ncbi:hypothetical protein HMI55_001407 [Coelomomyces lativittatus]|nr:hypothetical protein HMI55_001407 [Coelomomyces lativittatus]
MLLKRSYGDIKKISDPSLPVTFQCTINSKRNARPRHDAKQIGSKSLVKPSSYITSFCQSQVYELCDHPTPLQLPSLYKHLPTILHQLLEALSSLENQVFNYLSFHTNDQTASEAIDTHRLSELRASPGFRALGSLCIHLPNARSVVPNLDIEFANVLAQVLRTSVGVPPRVGVAQCVLLLSPMWATLLATKEDKTFDAPEYEKNETLPNAANTLSTAATLSATATTTPLNPASIVLKALSGTLTDSTHPTLASLLRTATASLIRAVPDATLGKLFKYLRQRYIDPSITQRGFYMQLLVSTTRVPGSRDKINQWIASVAPEILVSRFSSCEQESLDAMEVWQVYMVSDRRGVVMYSDEMMLHLRSWVTQVQSWPFQCQVAKAMVWMYSVDSTVFQRSLPRPYDDIYSTCTRQPHLSDSSTTVAFVMLGLYLSILTHDFTFIQWFLTTKKDLFSSISTLDLLGLVTVCFQQPFHPSLVRVLARWKYLPTLEFWNWFSPFTHEASLLALLEFPPFSFSILKDIPWSTWLIEKLQKEEALAMCKVLESAWKVVHPASLNEHKKKWVQTTLRPLVTCLESESVRSIMNDCFQQLESSCPEKENNSNRLM